MLDTQMIQTRGFRNTAGGFQVRLRLPYYRGVWTNLLVGAAIAVDDESFPAGSIHWSIGDGSYSLDEPHQPPNYSYAYQKAATKEFYA